MRSVFLFALLASAAVPAFAAGGPDDQEQHGRRGHPQSDQNTNDDGGQRQSVIHREAQSQSLGNGGSERQATWVRGQGGMSSVQGPENAARRHWDGNAQAGPTVVEQPLRRGPRNGVPRPDGEVMQGAPQLPQAQGNFDQRLRQYRQMHPRGEGHMQGHETYVTPPPNNSPVRSTFIGQHSNHWSGAWRDDHRYDWQRYRHQHRSLFNFGIYYDPYGYGYNRMRTGWSLWPSYFQSNYWLNDPWMYRLPPAYGPYRWVRYWDDALLVNTYTGQVVDVVYDFFW